MGRVILLTSFSACAIALFCSLDSLAPFRAKLGELIPSSLTSFAQHAFSAVNVVFTSDRLLTMDELSKYAGEDGGTVYLAILGSVYDVTRGRKHYGPGGGYSFFSGKDGSRAFVTGEFNEKGLTDDVTGLSNSDILSLEDWKKLYEKDYIYVGKLVGKYYTAEGKPTQAMEDYLSSLQSALLEKKAHEDHQKLFPPCNSEWHEGGHSRVWCTTLSGGIKRDWVGVPRQYYSPGQVDGKARCACVKNAGPPSDALDTKSHKNRGDLDNPNLRLYPGCDPSAESCILTKS